MRSPHSRALLRRTAALLLAALLLCSFPAQVLAAETKKPWLGSTYIISRPEETPVIIGGSTEDLDLTGYPVAFRDSGSGRDLAIAARRDLIVYHDGESYALESKLEPFRELFKRLGFTPSPLEAVRVEVFRGSVTVTVSTDVFYYERDVETSPYKTIRRPNASMPQGEEAVVQVGAVGEKGRVYEVYWSHGAVAGRQVVEELDSEPVDEIVEYGTAKPSKTAKPASKSVSVSRTDETGDTGGTLTLSSGETLRFTKAISMSATAYTTGHGGVGTRTASGTAVRVGVVAVDRSVIPLGTKLYIVANGGYVYGEAVAEDTGVRGNHIDLYLDTYEDCINFGRRDCMVYILEQ